MKIRRMAIGLSILMGSWWISGLITWYWGITSIGSIAISTIVGFVGGMIFISGPRKIVKEVIYKPEGFDE
jgi:hypothetical protein